MNSKIMNSKIMRKGMVLLACLFLGSCVRMHPIAYTKQEATKCIEAGLRYDIYIDGSVACRLPFPEDSEIKGL